MIAVPGSRDEDPPAPVNDPAAEPGIRELNELAGEDVALVLGDFPGVIELDLIRFQSTPTEWEWEWECFRRKWL